MFREVRRKTNIIGCFENKSSLNKILFFVFDFINQLLGNAYFNDILDLHNFKNAILFKQLFQELGLFCEEITRFATPSGNNAFF